jgi:hypothetical protein
LNLRYCDGTGLGVTAMSQAGNARTHQRAQWPLPFVRKSTVSRNHGRNARFGATRGALSRLIKIPDRDIRASKIGFGKYIRLEEMGSIGGATRALILEKSIGFFYICRGISRLF